MIGLGGLRVAEREIFFGSDCGITVYGVCGLETREEVSPYGKEEGHRRTSLAGTSNW